MESVETPFEYKLHLELLAKDVNKNPKLKNIREKKLKKTITDVDNQTAISKLKKSTSNPFLYLNERRDQIMEVQP